jgi:hypothetical protein
MGFALGGSFVWGWNFTPPSHPVASDHQHQQHSTQATQPADRKPEGTSTAPFFVQVMPSPKPAEERAQEEEDREEKKTADRWLVRWTFALFAATIGLILATGVLGYFAYRQADDMKASIKAADRAAKAADRSAAVAERSLTLADRPWVSLTIEIIEGLKFDPSLGCMTKVKLTLSNIGRSPAVALGYFIELCPSIEQAVTRHQVMLDSARSMITGISFGHTRFPNDPLEREIPLFIDQQKIETGIKENESGLVEPYIVACVYYGLPTGGRFRHTSVNRAIWLNDDTPGFAPAGYYPLDKISLSSFDGGQTT